MCGFKKKQPKKQNTFPNLFLETPLPHQPFFKPFFAYFDLKIKSYLLCILFVVFEESEHSFKGGQNDFLNTFSLFAAIKQSGAVISPPQGGKKKTPLNQNGGT